jgi:hypothetical protein
VMHLARAERAFEGADGTTLAENGRKGHALFYHTAVPAREGPRPPVPP